MDSSLPTAELHWLAGLLEGEGTFMVGPPSSPGLPVIAVNMTDHDVIARLGRIFERKVQVVRPRNARWQTSWSAGSETQAQKVIVDMPAGYGS